MPLRQRAVKARHSIDVAMCSNCSWAGIYTPSRTQWPLSKDITLSVVQRCLCINTIFSRGNNAGRPCKHLQAGKQRGLRSCSMDVAAALCFLEPWCCTSSKHAPGVPEASTPWTPHSFCPCSLTSVPSLGKQQAHSSPGFPSFPD